MITLTQYSEISNSESKNFYEALDAAGIEIKSGNYLVSSGSGTSQLGTPCNYESIGTSVTWLELVPELKYIKKKYFEDLKVIYKSIAD